MRLSRLFLVGCACLAFADSLRAQFILTVLTDTSTFSGFEQVIGFNSLPDLTPISTQFTSQDVTFSAGLIASTNSGDTNLYPNNADGVIATNWTGGSPALTWTITFAVAEVQAGFLVEMNTGDSVQLTTSLGGTTHGSVTYTSLGVTPVFFGVRDVAGFDALTFTVSGPDNHFFGMDNFRFESVPEPSVLTLIGLGLPLAGLTLRRAYRRKPARG
jgi:hypothetical protein